jgi:hypothetical protein
MWHENLGRSAPPPPRLGGVASAYRHGRLTTAATTRRSRPGWTSAVARHQRQVGDDPHVALRSLRARVLPRSNAPQSRSGKSGSDPARPLGSLATGQLSITRRSAPGRRPSRAISAGMLPSSATAGSLPTIGSVALTASIVRATGPKSRLTMDRDRRRLRPQERSMLLNFWRTPLPLLADRTRSIHGRSHWHQAALPRLGGEGDQVIRAGRSSSS